MLHKDAVKNRYSFEEPRNLSCVRECSLFPGRFLDSLSHTILMFSLTPTLTTARNDVKGNIVTGSDNGISEK